MNNMQRFGLYNIWREPIATCIQQPIYGTHPTIKTILDQRSLLVNKLGFFKDE